MVKTSVTVMVKTSVTIRMFRSEAGVQTYA
jgi:hypothetical protein